MNDTEFTLEEIAQAANIDADEILTVYVVRSMEATTNGDYYVIVTKPQRGGTG